MFFFSVPAPEQKPQIDRLIRDHSQALTRLCYLILKDYHLAQDIVQETLLRAYTRYAGFRGHSSERTWITRIAINLCTSLMRKASYRELALDNRVALEYASRDPELSRHTDTDSVRLLEAIYDLPPIYKQAVLMRYYQDMTVRDIARALRQKENTISARLKRAREMLKIKIGEDSR